MLYNKMFVFSKNWVRCAYKMVLADRKQSDIM